MILDGRVFNILSEEEVSEYIESLLNNYLKEVGKIID